MSLVLFSPGPILATADALRALEYNEVTPQRLICRHVGGDWGELPTPERRQNDWQVLAQTGAIVSRYRLDDGELVLVTTDFADGGTVISQPGDEKEMEWWAEYCRAAVEFLSRPDAPRYMVPISTELSERL